MNQLTNLLSSKNKLLLDQISDRGLQAVLVESSNSSVLFLANLYLKEILRTSTITYVEPDETNSIKIAAAREIIKNTIYLNNRKQFFIIDQAHLMTIDAQNSLLKSLEEPTENIFFILLTNQLTKILPTVKSRLHTIKLANLEISSLTNYLTAAGKTLTIVEQQQILFIAGDNLNLLLDLISNPILRQNYLTIAQSAQKLVNSSLAERLLIVQKYFSSREQAVILATISLKIYQTLTQKHKSNSYVLKLDNWLQTLERLQANCPAKLCLANAVI